MNRYPRRASFRRCGRKIHQRVPAGWWHRSGWRTATWHCDRPDRHDGPCAPRAYRVDHTDQLLAQWAARRHGG